MRLWWCIFSVSWLILVYLWGSKCGTVSAIQMFVSMHFIWPCSWQVCIWVHMVLYVYICQYAYSGICVYIWIRKKKEDGKRLTLGVHNQKILLHTDKWPDHRNDNTKKQIVLQQMLDNGQNMPLYWNHILLGCFFREVIHVAKKCQQGKNEKREEKILGTIWLRA